jgi:uncharacterized protein (DUF488 family)
MKESASPTKLIVMTIGSSTRTSEEFIQLLKAHQVQRPVDVRTVPRSRHNPQFNPSVLSPAMLPPSLHLFSRLGGFRHSRRDSLNAGWHNASFRGFADYMQMTESRGNLEEFIDLAKSEQIAIMCAEAVPWRCHRSLIAHVLLAHGIEVWEITSATRTQLHTLTLGQDHWIAGHLSCRTQGSEHGRLIGRTVLLNLANHIPASWLKY